MQWGGEKVIIAKYISELFPHSPNQCMKERFKEENRPISEFVPESRQQT
jgi:hypothetical protein